MIRHSRDTFATLFTWYGSCALVGVVTLFVVAGVLRVVGMPVTSENAALGMLIAAPFLVLAMVWAWRKIEPRYRRHQVKAMVTSSSGLDALEEMKKRKRWD